MGLLLVALGCFSVWMVITLLVVYYDHSRLNVKAAIPSMITSICVLGIAFGVAVLITTFSTSGGVTHSAQFYDVVTDGVDTSGEIVTVPLDNLTTRHGYVFVDNDADLVQDGIMINMVEDYRRKVYRYRQWEDSFFIGIFWNNMPDRIKPIVVE